MHQYIECGIERKGVSEPSLRRYSPSGACCSFSVKSPPSAMCTIVPHSSAKRTTVPKSMPMAPAERRIVLSSTNIPSNLRENLKTRTMRTRRTTRRVERKEALPSTPDAARTVETYHGMMASRSITFIGPTRNVSSRIRVVHVSRRTTYLRRRRGVRRARARACAEAVGRGLTRQRRSSRTPSRGPPSPARCRAARRPSRGTRACRRASGTRRLASRRR